VGELRKLGITVSATLVRKVLARAGLPPAPDRASSGWRSFLRQHENAILACDLFTVDTVWLRRLYVLFFVSIGTRRVEYVACTSNPDMSWMSQQARNLLMDLDDRSQRPRFLIHDRDTKFSRAFDAIFRSEGIEIVRTAIQAPNANAYAERWVGSVRRECLDRLLIFGRRQLEHVLGVYIRHFNQQRPHRALDLRPPDRRCGTDPSPQRLFIRCGSAGATSSADSSTNTKPRHEDRVCAPDALCAALTNSPSALRTRSGSWWC
jgi:putative transposase